MDERGPDHETLKEDPFAQMAEVLREEAAPMPPQRRRPQRKSRPSFSDLAPVLPPAPREAAPVPPVVVQRIHVVGQAPPSEPAPKRLSFLPSVIVADEDPPSFSVSPAPGLEKQNLPTDRRPRRGAPPPRGLTASSVVFLFGVSLMVFGAGIAALVYARSADLPFRTPAADTATRTN